MGILNVTPDSFSDGGKYTQFDYALEQAEQMIADGAIIIDIGGESTRPGAKAVSESDELARVIPVLKAIKQRFNIVVSIDTSKASVMSAAIDAGADMINDVRALQNDGCLAAIANSNIPVCLMHMQGIPKNMQNSPSYDDVINDIIVFFQQRIDTCISAGIARERLILDPGFGFGKTLEQNFYLLANLSKFNQLGLPLLAGLSRKSMIGNLLNREVEQRLAGSLATAIIAAQQGAHIIRVHDVQETVDALKVLKAVTDQQ
ncbi:dihydropteroate synthase [Colwellia sp. MB02u-18]|uniref:dihydropteroate synthase n=1 Tax=unclassified Colwellia TaxID=196834 RepID=UPI0015F636C4|nr:MULTISPECIES: dihydropteroate synthase [unclassified Colwellia]MBA6222820.1 dihydropteroate synthase [Colwellia sp. MB3u-45]MBA6266589.1 dihydropteroate synthase [Colwellia sp. MB3u-43]MBA6320413.1 dihydropteroate synthase [Colwellia sp. MB02u-19]MBA6323277.1 dihydropteroate synthase [Colwellia sp. MB02u-18]MBA6329798.1 dihydropteroate synthase [Colwellia sp. MB02u-12]